jgi:twitching motility protein PilT
MLASQAREFARELVARHVIARSTYDEAAALARETGEGLDQVLIRMVEIGPADLATGYAAAAGIPFVDLAEAVVHSDASKILPSDLATTHCALGYALDGRRLSVAFPMPADADVMHDVAEAVEAAGYEMHAVGAERSALEEALGEVYGTAVAEPVGLGKPTTQTAEKRLVDLIERTVALGASDLHLAADQPPFVRVLGELVRMPDQPVLSAAEVRELSLSIITARQRERFEETRELDTAYAIPGRVRLRVNLFVQRGAVGAAFRVIPFEVVPFAQIGIPPVVASFADLPRGLVLVTGPTGSGKSTTLASLIDLVNQKRQAHIITIEDPVEFVHKSKAALVNQREVGDDTAGFNIALTQALRQDPDVVLVGEMRDLETVSTAISAAETGHLVFATLHTQDSGQTVDRIVDVFPAEQQSQVRTQLANTIQGIVAQQLIPTADGRRRVPACEVLIATPALRSLIRDGKVHQIANTISSGRKQGMQTLDDSLTALVRAGEITPDAALRRARDPQGLASTLGVPYNPLEHAG